MIRQCAWCGSVQGLAPPFADERMTHTICPSCARKLLEDEHLQDGDEHLDGVCLCAAARTTTAGKNASHPIILRYSLDPALASRVVAYA